MKKYKKIALIYLVLGIIFGAFYREFTKFNNFSGKTALAFVHTHLIVLGFVIPFILELELKERQNKFLNLYHLLYQIFMPFVCLMLLIRGILDVTIVDLSNTINQIVSGFAGIAHLGFTVAIVFLLIGYFKKEN